VGHNYLKDLLATQTTNAVGFIVPENHPPGIYFKGTYEKTYFVWQIRTADGLYYRYYIKAWNHVTKTMSSTYLVDEFAYDMPDGHFAPAIGVLPNKKLIVFYHCHSNDPMYYKISTNAEDESSWGSRLNIPRRNWGWTYPNVLSYSDKVIIFARDSIGTNHIAWLMNTSVDGITWTGWVLINEWWTGDLPPNNHNAYFIFRKQGDFLLAAATRCYYEAPNYVYDNMYFAYSDDRGVTWKKADGTTINLPLTEADTLIAVAAHRTHQAYPILDADDRPCVTAANDLLNPVGPWKLRIARYWGAIGHSGEWTLDFVEDENGTDIEFGYLPLATMLKNGKISLIAPHGDVWGGNAYKMKLFREIEGQPYRFRVVHIDGTAAMMSSQAVPVEDADLAPDAIDWMVYWVVATADRKLYAFVLERKAESLPRKFDGTFILDGYLDHNKIIDYLEKVEEKE